MAMAQLQAAAGDFEAADRASPSCRRTNRTNPRPGTWRHSCFSAGSPPGGYTRGRGAERVAEAPDDTEARYRLAAQQVVANDIANAVENLLLIVQKDRKFGDDAGRVALLRLFDMLGDDPAVNRYRARMFNLLH